MHRFSTLSVLIFAVLRFLALEPSVQTPVAEVSRPFITRVFNTSQQPSRDGTFDFAVTRVLHSSTVAYVNAVIDLDNDGVINTYGIQDGKQEEWVVRNVPIPMTDDVLSDPVFSVWFDLSDMKIPVSAQKSCALIVTEEPLSVELPCKLADFKEWKHSTVVVSNSDWGTPEGLGQSAVSPRQGVSSGTATATPASHDGGMGHPFAIPDIAQRSNECGPTSTANSLIWLAHKYDFVSQLPAKADGSLDTTHLILDLMKSMAGNSRRPFHGLKGNQMYLGKRQYILDKKLPLQVDGGNEDGNSRGEETFNFVASHLAESQPAELLVWLADGGGHWVTVTGFARSEGRAFLYVHDPDDKKTARAVWEFSLDDQGKSTGELVSPRSCNVGWAVSEEPNSMVVQSSGTGHVAETEAVTAPFAWLKPCPEPENSIPVVKLETPSAQH